MIARKLRKFPSKSSRSLLRRALPALLVLAPAALFALLAWETCGFGTCPDVASLHAYQPGGAPTLLDRGGNLVGNLAPVERRIVPLVEFPRHLAEAFLAVEDQRFFEHEGIDWHRVGSVALLNWRSGSFVQGASTISMQLARTVFPDLLPLEERTLRRKMLEVRVASEIERRYTKPEILELYLNHVYLGRGLNGVENAAQEYFGIPARKLTLSQSAVLAAMARAPAKYDPQLHAKRLHERRDLVLRMMAEQGRIPPDVAVAAARSSLGITKTPPDRRMAAGLAPYFVEQVRRRLADDTRPNGSSATATIRTTLDSRIQRIAEEELQAQLSAIEKGAAGKFEGPHYDPSKRTALSQTDYLQGAIVVLDARYGDVLAWVGGRDFTQSRFDRVAEARRQAGSAFKPFVYSAAIAGGYSLSKPLDDSPVKIDLDRKRSWRPRNVRDRHEGVISMRNALVRSNNTATVRLAEEVGLDAIAASARNAGLRVDNDHPSLTLGAIHVTPLELTAAYSSFANAGTRVEPRMVLQVEDDAGNVLSKPGTAKRRSLDAGTAYLLTDVLSDVIRRGTGQEAKPKRADVAVAGKTGTTNDVTDAWFIGYTPDIVAGVWIGFDTPRPIVDEATAARLAAPVWGRVIDRIYEDRPIPQPWNMPDGVRKYPVDVASGQPLGAGCRSSQMAEELFIAAKTRPGDCEYEPVTGPKVVVVDGRWSRGRADENEGTTARSPFGEVMVVQPEPVEVAEAPSRALAKKEEAPTHGPAHGPAKKEEARAEARPRILPPAIYEVGAPDLSGSWALTTLIRSTAVPEFRGMRLGYYLELEQRGRRVVGRGRKLSENGRPITGPARTDIELDGNVQGSEVTLAFREQGARRASGGTFRFSVSPDSRGLGGTFDSDAADSSGSAVATKVR
jgi:1A family penicillin-binding protein